MGWGWYDILIQSAICVSVSDYWVNLVRNNLAQMTNLSPLNNLRERDFFNCVFKNNVFEAMLYNNCRGRFSEHNLPTTCGHVMRQEFENWPL